MVCIYFPVLVCQSILPYRFGFSTIPFKLIVVFVELNYTTMKQFKGAFNIIFVDVFRGKTEP